jgi:sodium/potassium-transporting ATPase subunit alpha
MVVTDCLIGQKTITANAAATFTKTGSQHSDDDLSATAIINLAEISSLCNAGEFDATTIHLPSQERKIFGDATDKATLRFAESILSVSKVREQWNTRFSIPFNSKNKFMVNVIQSSNEKETQQVLTIKGAPDILFPKCTHYMTGTGAVVPLTDEHRAFVEYTKNQWSKQARRVILVARKSLGDRLSHISSHSVEFEDAIERERQFGLELVGLVGIVDPPRDEIPGVISILRDAGIKVHVVTGDFQLTGLAVAIECGIVSCPHELVDTLSALSDTSQSVNLTMSKRAIVLSGADMMSLDEEEWDLLARYDEIVFARTTPEQKLKIVKELQKRGEVVASKCTI